MTTTQTDPLTANRFVHLRVHSEFSVVDGIVRIDDLAKAAARDQQVAVALTDLANLFGMVKHYKAARGQGVKPIIGCDTWIENTADLSKPHRLLLLVQNQVGYHNLCELLSKAYLTNQSRECAQIKFEWLHVHHEGLIALSGARAGSVGAALEAGKRGAAEQAAKQLAAVFPNRFYIELQRSGHERDEAYVQGALRVAAKCGIPVVATHPVQFLEQTDFRAHEARTCIAQGEILGNTRRVRLFNDEQYLKTQTQMCELFADIPSAIENTLLIAQRCNLQLVLGKARLPDFPTPGGMSLDDYLRELSAQGLEQRMLKLYPDPAQRQAQLATYEERLKIECDVIIKMGFPGYFLIVADFINWGKNNGVPIGPGRGSGAGSLVAYSLGITDIDPLKYDLLFERFLNPERVSMPDFDIDFCQENRDRVIDYVKRKYGEQSVSQIATFGTLAAKAVVKDVGRVLDLGYNYCDGLSKLIPHNPTDPWDLKRTLEEEPAFKERVENEEEARGLIELALPLEGITRNVGMHAGGVLIAPGKLTDFCPLYAQHGKEDSVVSQFDKDDVEAMGLVKFDFLGLRNLTILELAVRYVRDFNPDRTQFSLDDLPLDDPAVYKLFAAGNTTAVFQSESRSAKDLEKKLKADTFEDIIALMALNRPGPLGSGMVDDFIARKSEQRRTGKGKAEWYFHPNLEPVLKSTYGVMVYQEQVMLVAQILAGYSLGGADLLRRAMGKKKKEEMDKQREIFTTGAVERGVSQELATHLFDLMAKFADYGFNKSHSAAYALIAYQTAWLKAYHCAEFMAATLSSDMDKTDKVTIFHADTVENGITILPPDVNASEYYFVPVRDEHSAKGKPPRTIRYGLGAVKGTGRSAVDSIIEARQSGPFTGLVDFCCRVDRQAVNRRTVEALVRAGAFDSLDANRAQVLANVGLAIDAADQRDAAANQVSLFGDSEPAATDVPLVQTPAWDPRQTLREEKTALGFYFSGHLFTSHAHEVRQFIKTSLADLAPKREVQWMCGILAQVRTQMTKRGKMVFAVLDDGTAQVEVTVFNELFDKHRALLREDELLVIRGKVSFDEYSGNNRIVADELFDLAGARQANARQLSLSIKPSASQAIDAQRLLRMLEPYRAKPQLVEDENGTRELITGLPIEISYLNDQARGKLWLGEQWRVHPNETLLKELQGWLSPEGAQIVY